MPEKSDAPRLPPTARVGYSPRCAKPEMLTPGVPRRAWFPEAGCNHAIFTPSYESIAVTVPERPPTVMAARKVPRARPEATRRSSAVSDCQAVASEADPC